MKVCHGDVSPDTLFNKKCAEEPVPVAHMKGSIAYED